MNFKIFFELSRSPCFIMNNKGMVIESNPAAKTHQILPNQNLFEKLLPSDIDKINKVTKENTDPVLIQLISFPELLLRTRWNVKYMDENSDDLIFQCEELSKFSPEDFLLHTGLMKTIFDKDPNLITISNSVGIYLFVNHAVYLFAGLAEQKSLPLINQMAEEGEIWLPASDKRLNPLTKEITDIELTTDTTGKAVWFENIHIPLKLPFGEEVRLVISKDITNWKLSEKKLVDHQQSLFHTTKLSYLGEMAGSIAHEINNPLAIILGNSQILKRNLESEGKTEDDQIIKSLQKIESMAVRISKIIKMMRNLSKESNTVPYSLAKISDLLTSVVSTIQDKLNAFEIEVTFSFNQLEDIEISCHPAEITQVFLNILVNAIDSLLQKTNTDEKHKIEIKLTKTNSTFIFINFIDNGIGINSEIVDRIFEPFYTTKPIGKGTGLGLSVSKKIVEEHFGELYFNKNEPLTTFTIKLPIAQAM